MQTKAESDVNMEELDILNRLTSSRHRIISFMLRVQLKAMAIRLRTNSKPQDEQSLEMNGQQCSKEVSIGLEQDSLLNEQHKFENITQPIGFRWRSVLKMNDPASLTSFIFSLYLVYLIIKFPLLALLQYEHDWLLPKLKAGFKDLESTNNSGPMYNETSSPEAREWDQLSLTNNDKFNLLLKQFKQCVFWMDLLGNPAVSGTGATIVLFGSLASVPIVFFLFRLNNSAQLDRTAFFLNPIGARRAYRNELSGLIGAIISATREFSRPGPVESSSYDPQTRFKKTHASVRVLLDIERSGKLEPVNLSARWHKSLSNHHLADVGQILFGTLFLIGLIVVLVAQELIIRVQFRLAELQRGKWPAQADMANNTLPSYNQVYRIHLRTDLSEAHKQAYSDYDGSWFSLAALALFIEFPFYYLTPRVFLTLVDYSLICLHNVIVGTFSLDTYLHGCTDKIVWLRQIDKQIKDCINLLSKRAYSYDDLIAQQPEKDRPRYYSFHQLAELHSRDQIESLALAYLNMEMFRRRQSKFKHLVNIVIAQYSVLTLYTGCIVYLVCKSIQNTSATILLMLPSLMMVFANMILIVGAALTRSLERHALNLIRLAAFESVASRQAKHLLRLWSRQIIGGEEMLQLYAPSVFGLALSTENIILANAYFIGLWLVSLN